jgi:hypothetical protein
MLTRRDKPLRERDPNATSIMIPASVRSLAKSAFPNRQLIQEVKFQAGSQITRFEAGTFGFWKQLKFLRVPASVEVIVKHCFYTASSTAPSALRVVTFERGSKLREIEEDAFFNCPNVEEISLPPSVQTISVRGLPHTNCRIELAPGKTNHFEISEDLLIHLDDHVAIDYFGDAPVFTIPEDIVTIGERCFFRCETLEFVRFWVRCALTSIGARACSGARNLKEINLPASVTSLGEACFSRCRVLETITFCAPSTLETIPDEAFMGCEALVSIALPASVKTLGDHCFSECWALAQSPVQADSQVVRIGRGAFSCCDGLTSFRVPSSVEVVGFLCFSQSDEIRSLTFELPSHLRMLQDLPANLSGFVHIPDSVEKIEFYAESNLRLGPVLMFGRDSKMEDFQARTSGRAFMQFSTATVKFLRRYIEYWEDDDNIR